MRIALITDGIWPLKIGGIQRHSYYLIKYLIASKVYTDVYLPGGMNECDLITKLFNEKDIAYLSIKTIAPPSVYKYPGHYFVELYQYSKKVYAELSQITNEYDLIYIQGLAGAYILKNKQALNSVCVLSPHGLEMFQETFSLKTKMEQFLFSPFTAAQLRKADYVHSLGGRLNEILKKKRVKPGAIFDCNIGIEEKWCANSIKQQSGRRKLAFIGRNERRKGIIELKETLEQLIAEGREFEFHFIGNINIESQIKDKKCIYHGEIKEDDKIKQILDEVDFLVVPSCAEGMPTVILEAMSRNCAIIGTDVGAVSKQVADDNGILIMPKNIGALKTALIKALEMSDGELKEKQLQSGNKLRRAFLWEQVISKMTHFFATVSKKQHKYGE